MANPMWGGRKDGAHDVKVVGRWSLSEVKNDLSSPRCRHSYPRCRHSDPRCRHSDPRCRHSEPEEAGEKGGATGGEGLDIAVLVVDVAVLVVVMVILDVDIANLRRREKTGGGATEGRRRGWLACKTP